MSGNSTIEGLFAVVGPMAWNSLPDDSVITYGPPLWLVKDAFYDTWMWWMIERRLLCGVTVRTERSMNVACASRHSSSGTSRLHEHSTPTNTLSVVECVHMYKQYQWLMCMHVQTLSVVECAYMYKRDFKQTVTTGVRHFDFVTSWNSRYPGFPRPSWESPGFFCWKFQDLESPGKSLWSWKVLGIKA